MKPELDQSKKKLSKDQQAFEELPAPTQELLLLKEESEKATGKHREDVDNQIQPKSGQRKS